MKRIVTLTLNPSVDGASEAEAIRPTRKIRTTNERFDPGGGGINVARVVGELGGDALALYTAGGATGALLTELMTARGIPGRRLPISDVTRISHSVYERSSGLEYRFVPEGPALTEAEAADCLRVLAELPADYIVASGSLPRGVAPGFYAELAGLAKKTGARLVLDTSGPSLAEALGHGGVHLVKPSLGEFEALVGHAVDSVPVIQEAASELVRKGAADLVAVTMGHRGAVLASAGEILHLRVPDVRARSTVGAGDSFVAGMTFALAAGRPVRDAFALGVAAGTAAVLQPGTALCRREDVERLHADLLRALG